MAKAHETRGPLQAEVVEQIRRFSAGVVLFNQMVAEKVRLHPTDVQCLNLLDLLGTCTPGKLAEGMGLTTGGVTVMLDRLERAGYIKREPNPDDRRSLLVRVSAKRKEKLDVHYAAIIQQLDTYVGRMAERDLNTVIRFLHQVNSIRIDAAGG
jgi:MarR family transcriptional regulator, organic hydroperoxide resistance regulator